ncbi:glycerate kinase, partial [Candidatus Poribacteria bacterium]|nr:glycerate kinase [Candidatus Poribacteria bacterium]
MKIVIAPDSFKGSVTALQAAEAIEHGVRRVFPDTELEKIPM